MNALRYPPSLSSQLAIVLATARMRLINISRYRGQLLIDLFMPIVLAALPILLGRATGGDQAAVNFARNTGTQNYVAYMLIGSSVFSIVSYAFWHVGYWLRLEQETGTLEAIYLTPSSRILSVAGVALYSATRSFFTALAAFLLGCLIFGVDPLQGETLLAVVFILVGLIPIFGLALLFGALILKVREANALINLMQWLVSFLMGMYFPIAILPPLMRLLAMLFPPTWMIHGVRSALLGVGYFFEHWYLDLAVLWGFMLLTPMFGAWVFRQVETQIRRHEGLGEF